MPASEVNQAGHELQMRELPRDGMREFFVTRARANAAGLTLAAEHLDRNLAASVVAAECFDGADPAGGRALLRRPGMPVTWVRGETSGDGLGGVHLHAIADRHVRPLELDGRMVGALVDGPHAAECLLAGIHTDDVHAPRPEQARDTFERIERTLALAGMDFSHVVRTWLFLDDILSWYPDFNRVRTTFFTERGVFDGLVPASTGIGGANLAGAAMVAGVYAVRANSPAVSVQALPSPLQCPALRYGSSFSRAVEVAMPDVRRVLVSGTASIDPDGVTAHVGDVYAQTARTCDVIAAILDARDMGWEDVTRATAYVRFPQDVGVFERYRTAAGIPPLPVIIAHNVICRDDLLFELEVDAVRTSPGQA